MNKLLIHDRTCTTCGECVLKCGHWCQKHLCNAHIYICAGAQARTPVWCHTHHNECTYTRACHARLCNGAGLCCHENECEICWVLCKHREGCRLPHAHTPPRCSVARPRLSAQEKPSKVSLAQDAVVTAMLYKHHPITVMPVTRWILREEILSPNL